MVHRKSRGQCGPGPGGDRGAWYPDVGEADRALVQPALRTGCRMSAFSFKQGEIILRGITSSVCIC